ncbi:DUF6635 family protein [Oleispirillum naphthae]|uniref:DUF6635 family protein n=1 Tax=Oleispirillum naphthae TaxID=2838853 RepID=UPI00308261C7
MTGEDAALPVPAGGISPPAVVLSRAAAEALLLQAAARYVTARRQRIAPFIDRHFSFRGSLALHRHALGPDLLRAPYNLMVSLPEFALRRSGAAAAWAWGKSGRRPPALVARAARARLALDTDVGRRVNHLLMTELLELPVKDATGRVLSARDALAVEILADPRLAAGVRQVERLVAERADSPEFRAAVARVLAGAAAGRAAMAEMALQAGALGLGAGAFHAFTPGVLSLTPMVSAALANGLAISAFPLGGAIGGWWYAAFPAAATPFLTAATGGALLFALASAGALAGVAADPVQRRLGLHRKRLERLVEGLARDLAPEEGAHAPLPPLLADHYLPRLLDLVDLINGLAALR